MYNDIVDLNHFYQTKLGQAAQDCISSHMLKMWPDIAGQKVLGVGYASPYLDRLADQGAQLINFMPAQQGVTWWPTLKKNASALIDEGELPLDDQSVDKVLLVHSLECTEKTNRFLREVWRVLSGQGRLLVIVPNRRGWWARSDYTPFGHGRSFSHGQLRTVLSNASFLTTRPKRALFFPPFESRFWVKFAHSFDEAGARFCPGFSGVYMMEAVKQIYGARPEAVLKGSKALSNMKMPSIEIETQRKSE